MNATQAINLHIQKTAGGGGSVAPVNPSSPINPTTPDQNTILGIPNTGIGEVFNNISQTVYHNSEIIGIIFLAIGLLLGFLAFSRKRKTRSNYKVLGFAQFYFALVMIFGGLFGIITEKTKISLAATTISLNPTSVFANIIEDEATTKNYNTEITVNTNNATGYKIKLSADQLPAGVEIKIDNTNITTTPVQIINATTTATTNHAMQIIIDEATATEGDFAISLNFSATENAPTPPPITGATLQNFNCASLTNIFDNTDLNDTTMSVVLPDSRDGMLYRVAKMADGNCWMLTNLRLGGANPITLTSADTNFSSANDSTIINDQWTLPALSTPPNNDLVNPVIFDPGNVSTDPDDLQNYGYFYNLSAATIGYSDPAKSNSGQSPNDICPFGWSIGGYSKLLDLKNLYPSFADFNTVFHSVKSGVYSPNRNAFRYIGVNYSMYWLGYLGWNVGNSYYIDENGNRVGNLSGNNGISIRCVAN